MKLLAQIVQLRQQIQQQGTLENAKDRHEVLAETRGLLLDLEKPDDTIGRAGYQLAESITVTTAIKMNLFKALKEAPLSTEEDLARRCNADATLTGRILRCLAAHGCVQQISPNTYSPNAISRTFAEPGNAAGMISCNDLVGPGLLAIPSFLQQRNWRIPPNPTDIPLSPYGDKVFWEIVATHPAHDALMVWIKYFNQSHKVWSDIYPLVERLGSKPTAVFMVDVGGGRGQQAANAKREFPELAGRFVVQDLSHAFPPLEDREEGVEYMEHDFTTEQPIKGARLYYTRYVMHNWSQDGATLICTQLRKAMKPGYSKLIINDWILPDVGASKLQTAMDINMINCAGMERTLAMHREYLEKAGLRISGVWDPEDGVSEAVIEAEVAEGYEA